MFKVTAVSLVFVFTATACAIGDDSATDHDAQGTESNEVSCGAWTTTVVDAPMTVGAAPRVAVDAGGALHVIYADVSLSDLKYATRPRGGSWNLSRLVDGASTMVGQWDALEIDSANTVHVIYTDYNNTTRGLWYRSRPSNGAWSAPAMIDPLVSSVAREPALAIDAAGVVHVTYRDETHGSLRYARKSVGATTFTRQLIESNNVGSYSSIVADSSGGIHVVYFDITNWRLQYRYKPSTGSFAPPMTLDDTKDVGRSTSMVTGSDGAIHLAYTLRDSRAVKYMVKGSTGWSTPVTVDTVAGEQSSVSVDGSAGVHIAYRDTVHHTLGYAYKSTSGAFELTTIDATGDVGSQLSSTVEPGGEPHVLYYDLTNGDLKYATRSCEASSASPLVINEVDYDMLATDSAEFIELYNPSAVAAPLEGKQLLLLNGANGAVYATISLTGTIAGSGYLVIAGPNVTVPPPAMKLDPGWTSDRIQNGAPDGIALIDRATHTLIDALSYEGSMTTITLPGFAAPVSLVEGTATPASDAADPGSLCRRGNQDTDDAAADWRRCSAPTPGVTNPNGID